MEGGLPMLNCLLQHSLKTLCACSDSSTPSKWVYAVFWRILPRNYPPPKWDHGGSFLDRAKGNKRNWILVWEDGFCDFVACERAGYGYGKGIRFGADIFFKMSHQVYNFGEGLVGKVASDNSHKWVYNDAQNQNDPGFISSWSASIDPQPRAWEAHFSSGIETIAIISVRGGAIQLGSFVKVVEDLNLVLSIQRKFSYLQSIPGMYAMHRPYHSIQTPSPSPTNLVEYPNSLMAIMQKNESLHEFDVKPQITTSKRLKYDENDDDWPSKTICLGHNSPQSQNRFLGTLPLYSIPPLLPSVSGNLGTAFLSKIHSNPTSCSAPEAADRKETVLVNHNGISMKSGINQNLVADDFWGIDFRVEDKIVEGEKAVPIRQKLKSED